MPGRIHIETGTGDARRNIPRTRFRLVWALTVGALVAAVVGTGLWFRHVLDGPAARGEFEVTVVIARGTPYSTILARLRSAGLLAHPFAFDYLAWRRGDAARLRPGRYRLRSSMSLREIYDTLLQGAPVRLTVPEGWTLAQIADELVERDLLADPASFTSATRDAALLARHAIEASSAEGYVLAETYLFDPGVTGPEILETMLDAFDRRYAAEARTTRPLHLTWHEVLTLASMIEREARSADEKPRIASVYYNRLRRSMKLDCDATVRYALDQWAEPLTRADLQVDSPYNTYRQAGLPPGPICCVGGDAIHAALNPESTPYLYYCYKGDGTHQFSKTLAEHQRAVKKFLRKRLTAGPGRQ